MKHTMNSRDVAKYHKYLEQDISLEECSKFLGISKTTLLRFSPEKTKAAQEKALAIAEGKLKAPSKAKALAKAVIEEKE